MNIEDLNDLGSDSTIVVALDINVPSIPTVRLVRNTTNITYMGNEYISFPFEIGEISAGKGETPQFQLKLDNTNRVIEQYLVQYDTYLKQNGIDGNIISAVVHVLNTNDLSDSILTEYFELTDFSADAQTATFNLGTMSLFNSSFPIRKMYASFCTFKFKDGRCKYAGSASTCNKTLSNCRALNNSVNYGGFVGLSEGVRI